MSHKSDRSLLPKDLAPGEEAFLKEWGPYFNDLHPNPDRKGCPGKEALQILAANTEAFRRRPDSRNILAHLGSCGPCGQELMELRYRAVRSRQLKILLWAAGGLTIFALAGLAVWKMIVHK